LSGAGTVHHINHVVSHRRKQRAFLPSNHRESVTDLPIGA
jgi:hypothetical protein